MMQAIAAAHRLPDLVPKALNTSVGADAAVDGKGRRFQFSVMEYVEGDTLEVWDQLSLDNHRTVAADLADTVRRLHRIRLEDEVVQEILSGLPTDSFAQSATFCGPALGILADWSALLAALGQKWQLEGQHIYDIEAEGDDFVVRSVFHDVPHVTVTAIDISNGHVRPPSATTTCRRAI